MLAVFCNVGRYLLRVHLWDLCALLASCGRKALYQTHCYTDTTWQMPVHNWTGSQQLRSNCMSASYGTRLLSLNAPCIIPSTWRVNACCCSAPADSWSGALESSYCASCPENAFQVVQPGMDPYSTNQRLGAIMCNGLTLLCVGFLASVLGALLGCARHALGCALSS